MKKVMVSAIIVFALSAAFGADPWKLDLNTNLTTALNSYSDNWTGGEAGSFTWATQFLGVAERQCTKIINTKSTLKLQFGQTKLQNKESKDWSVPQKSSDLIDGEELLRFTLGSWVDPFASVRGISQFIDSAGHNGNPFDLTEALGVSRTLRKNDNIDWATRVGLATHQLIDRYHPDTATGGTKTDVTNDGGAEFNMDIKATNTKKWVTLLSSLQVYEAVLSSKAKALKGTPEENFWRYPRVKWENTLTLTFAKYLMLNMTAFAYYDKDISSNIRLKETLSAGLTYIYTKK
jgi:hypothetical protein